MAASMKQVCLFRQLYTLRPNVSLSGCLCSLPIAERRPCVNVVNYNYGSSVWRTRCYSTEHLEDKIKPPIKPKRYALDRLVKFITSSADKLEKRLPSVFQVYRTFRTGVSSFVSDTKDYYRVTSRLWSGESLAAFSRKELELYRQFSSDLPLVGLIFVIAFAPGGVAVFPFAMVKMRTEHVWECPKCSGLGSRPTHLMVYVFPRHLLSHHFWTPLQKEEFRRIALTKRLKHYESILDYLHLLSQHIEDAAYKESVHKAIQKLDSNVLLTSQEILELTPLFEGKPYNMDCLSLRHMRHLGKSLGLSVRRRRLVKDALLLHYMDVAMVREGINNMTDEELDKACDWRGLNPQGLWRKDKITYLESWTQVSATAHESSISLLLHLPVLLGYCLSSNRELMGPKSTRLRGRLS